MDQRDLMPLLRLAELVQARAKQEKDPRIKESLGLDLVRIKDELGRIVLDLPPGVQVFPTAKEENWLPDAETSTLVSDIPLASPQRKSPAIPAAEPVLPPELIAAKFEAFMKTKAKRKSRIPVSAAV
jgi:hypothetical protein